MNRRNALALLAAAPLGACMTPEQYAGQIEGVWVPESAELGGHSVPIDSFKGATLTLKAGHYDFVTDRGTYKLLSAGGQLAMDVLGSEGPNQGRTLLAIFRVQAERLVICYELGPGPRPVAFESPPGSKVLLITYRRAV